MNTSPSTPILATEQHPWPPFIPVAARVIMLGTFPPKPSRWSMDFFYPNRINDMWRIMGLVFMGDSEVFWDATQRRFRLEAIKQFLTEHGIALWDTAMEVRRLKDNASDKYLEIVRPIDLARLLAEHPTIRAVVTTGEKATGVVAAQAGITSPAIGIATPCEVDGHGFDLWRMPSSSRAYPLPLARKADAYRALFATLGML